RVLFEKRIEQSLYFIWCSKFITMFIAAASKIIGSQPNSGKSPNVAMVACSLVSFFMYWINPLAKELPVPPPIANGTQNPLTGSGERAEICFCISNLVVTFFINVFLL